MTINLAEYGEAARELGNMTEVSRSGSMNSICMVYDVQESST
jgi:hypothetical protein